MKIWVQLKGAMLKVIQSIWISTDVESISQAIENRALNKV